MKRIQDLNKSLIQNENQNLCQNKKVVIIGGGTCGILCLKYLKDFSEIICLEQKDELGGQWKFDGPSEITGDDLSKDLFYQKTGYVQSSVYEDLRTNIPKQFMTFRDFPHEKSTPTFMTQKQYHDYILGYVKKFDLQKNVKLNCYVENVEYSEEPQKGKFQIETRDSKNWDHKQTFFADYVIVANGHQSKQFIPEIQGLKDSFKGIYLHTHQYRQKLSEKLKQKNVLLYGGAFSAMDMIYFMTFKKSIQPNNIYMAGSVSWMNNSTDYKELIQSKKIQLVNGRIKQIKDYSVLFENGVVLENIEVIIFATGYVYDFPFLKQKSKINKESWIKNMIEDPEHCCIEPIYRKIWNIDENNLIFAGLYEFRYLMFVVFERQARVIASFVKGLIKLPSKQEMQIEFEQEKKEIKENKLPMYKFYKFGTQKYFDQLQTMSQIPYNQEYENDLALYRKYIQNNYETKADFISTKQFDFQTILNPKFNPTTEFF